MSPFETLLGIIKLPNLFCESGSIIDFAAHAGIVSFSRITHAGPGVTKQPAIPPFSRSPSFPASENQGSRIQPEIIPMRILAIERERTNPPHTNLPKLQHDEAAGLWDLTKRDVVRELWYTADSHAIIMLECGNGTEARKYLADLPLVRNGLIDFTVYELHNHDGFERLIADGTEPVEIKQREPAEY